MAANANSIDVDKTTSIVQATITSKKGLVLIRVVKTKATFRLNVLARIVVSHSIPILVIETPICIARNVAFVPHISSYLAHFSTDGTTKAIFCFIRSEYYIPKWLYTVCRIRPNLNCLVYMRI